MKILVKKDNGLLEVGKTYEVVNVTNTVVHPDKKACTELQSKKEIILLEYQINEWLKNGYIEEVKEVGYAWHDVLKILPLVYPEFADKKQYEQTTAFSKLTHVRAKILKDKGFEDFTFYKDDVFYVIQYSVKFDILEACSYYYSPVTALLLRFPTKETAELALQHNQELFKTYLGV